MANLWFVSIHMGLLCSKRHDHLCHLDFCHLGCTKVASIKKRPRKFSKAELMLCKCTSSAAACMRVGSMQLAMLDCNI